MLEQAEYFGISKDRAVYAHGEKDREFSTNWSYDVFLVDENGRPVYTPFSGVKSLKEVADCIQKYWNENSDKVKYKAVVPFDRCLNNGSKRGIHFEREYARSNYQVGQISDRELGKLSRLILDLEKIEEEFRALLP